MKQRCFLIPLLFISFLLSATPEEAKAQDSYSDQEVFLQFRHQGVVSVYASALYIDDQFYLSISEFFNALRIDHEIDTGNMRVTGRYLDRGRYTIDFQSRSISFEGETFEITADDYVLADIGYYLKPSVLRRVFDLDFTVDFNNLAVSLQTDDTMPVVAQRQRERQRERMIRTQRELYRTYFPLQYEREKNLFRPGFLDYNFTANYTGQNNSLLFNTAIGAELAGGDLQGSIFGNISETSTTLRSSNLRWRYGIRDNRYISRVVVGQATATGLSPVAFTGVQVSNEPIEPRFLYDQTVFSGTVEPDSEVELYRNNTLVDFQQADAGGDYRFVVPLTYGTSTYSIRTYGPTGQMSEREARIQVPFNFLPPGEVTYTFDAGRLDNPLSGQLDRGFVTKANVSGGVTNWLTARAGVEYFEDFHTDIPTFSGGLSSRFLTNYLVALEAANDAFYRASLNVIYPNAASINTEYTYFNRQGGIYNPGRNVSRLRTSIFTPFTIGDFPLYFRWSFTSEERQASRINRYRIDLNTRLGRANIRIGYRDSQINRLRLESTATARLTGSATYTFGRGRNTPTFIRGVFVRSQVNYIPSISEIEDAELQLSRNFLRQGRFQISGGHNFIGDFNFFRFGLTFDFNRVRSSTTARSNRGNFNASQSVRGSMGYDPRNSNVLFTNRQQVGRSGLAVRLFVDNNNSGTYDEGDELLPESAVRIERAGGRTELKNGINYISQLQPYRQYNLTINKAAISNPMIVPSVGNFSIVTDPNQYKPIDIPFYTSGVIDGMVNRIVNDDKQGVGGLRLYLTQINTTEGVEPHTEEIRTFSDGSFYAFEIPPGDYELAPDPSQLGFLNVVADPRKLEFTVEAIAQGDFVEGLEILLMDEDDIEEIELEQIQIAEDFDMSELEDSLTQNMAETLRFIIKAQNSFYSRDFNNAINYVDQSLGIFETAQGYALKGSLNYLRGNKVEAQRNWQLAIRFNPDIYIPDVDELDQLITTEFMD